MFSWYEFVDSKKKQYCTFQNVKNIFHIFMYRHKLGQLGSKGVIVPTFHKHVPKECYQITSIKSHYNWRALLQWFDIPMRLLYPSTFLSIT